MAFDKASAVVEGKESSGIPGVVGQQTPYGQPLGLMQTLPATAHEMADKLGVPWNPSLLTAKTPEAANYQRTLGNAYLQEGYQKTGNWPDAFRYYYGGPNRTLWGPKTNAYAADAMRRMGTM